MDIPKHTFEITETMMICAALVIALLVVSSASMVQAADECDGCTDLERAARGGDLKEVIRLLDHGADVNEKNKYGNTVLDSAKRWGHVDVVKALLDKGADVHAKTKDKTTTIMEYVKDFLDKLASVSAKQKHYGRTKMVGSKQDYVEIVKLLKAYGAEE